MKRMVINGKEFSFDVLEITEIHKAQQQAEPRDLVILDETHPGRTATPKYIVPEGRRLDPLDENGNPPLYGRGFIRRGPVIETEGREQDEVTLDEARQLPPFRLESIGIWTKLVMAQDPNPTFEKILEDYPGLHNYLPAPPFQMPFLHDKVEFDISTKGFTEAFDRFRKSLGEMKLTMPMYVVVPSRKVDGLRHWWAVPPVRGPYKVVDQAGRHVCTRRNRARALKIAAAVKGFVT